MFKYRNLFPRIKTDFFVKEAINELQFLQIKCNYMLNLTRAIVLTNTIIICDENFS